MKRLRITLLFIVAIGAFTGKCQTRLLTAAMTPYCINGCSGIQSYGVKNVLDRNVNTKFADTNKNNTGFYVDTKIDSRVTKLELTTANDAPENDPSGFRLLGSNDGDEWQPIYQSYIPCNSPRLYTWGFTFTNFEIFSWYRVEFLSVCDSNMGKGIHVAEVQLYRSSITLPIKLLTFTGLVNNQYPTLQWNLAQPEDGAIFEIEQSINGQNFSRIDTVIQSGNSTVFVYIDRNKIYGAKYYRLKITERSQYVQYSKIILLKAGVSANPVQIFPNPFKKGETLYLTNFKEQVQGWRLYTLAGINIATGNSSSVSESIILPATVASGTYLLQIIMGNATVTQKLIIH